MKFSIVIPTYNRWDLLSKCLKSIKNNTDLTEGEVIVVSNGCQDNTPTFFDLSYKNSQFHMLHWPAPLGYPKAVNLGMSAATGDVVILLNNDTIFLGNHWYEMLTAPLSADPKAGITGVIKRFQGGKPWVLFFCAAIKRDVINKIGLLDETFTPGCGEDIDYCLRAYNAGYNIVQTPDEKLTNIANTNKMTGAFPIFHEGGVTVNKNPNQSAIYSRNIDIVAERYGLPTWTQEFPDH